MRYWLIVLSVTLAISVTSGSFAAADREDATPAQQIAALKKQLRVARLNNADLQDQIDAQNSVISDQADTIQRLRTKLANQPDPLDVITARSPDGLWAAMLAIWQAFPALPVGLLCGYDKNSVPGDGIGLTLTSFTFFRWTGC